MRTRNVLLLAAAAAVALASRTDATPATRAFAFTYEVKIPKPADGSKRLEAWIPLPIEDDLQKVADLEVEATHAGQAVPVKQGKDATYGNRIAHVAVDAPSGEVVMRWSAKITRAVDEGQGKGPVLERFRQPDDLIPITGRAAELAEKVGAKDASAPVRDRAKRIYDDVLTTMVYDKETPGWGKGDFERACDVCKGNCTDFHAKFIGVGRAAAIPVRFTMGISLTPKAEDKTNGYHCWAHFHDGTTWVPVDISEAQKVNAKDPAKAQWFFGHLDADRIALTVGRDITLEPKQKGPALLHFVHPYAEVDGKPVDLPKESRTFSWKNL